VSCVCSGRKSLSFPVRHCWSLASVRHSIIQKLINLSYTSVDEPGRCWKGKTVNPSIIGRACPSIESTTHPPQAQDFIQSPNPSRSQSSTTPPTAHHPPQTGQAHPFRTSLFASVPRIEKSTWSDPPRRCLWLHNRSEVSISTRYNHTFRQSSDNHTSS
jgi:hypothetical protein